MGGGKRYPYPRHVWSPTGGWWCEPRNWKRSTAFAFMGIVAGSIPVIMFDLKHNVAWTEDKKLSNNWYQRLSRWYRGEQVWA